MKKNVHDLSHNELKNLIVQHKEPEFRVQQIWQGLYGHHYTDWSDFSSLSKSLRHFLAENFNISTLVVADQIFTQDLLTEKILFRLPDGNHIETVLLRKGNRKTLCVSTQIGCPIGCVFCATGKMKFVRNLTSGEIIEQILFFTRKLSVVSERPTNIVIMGMGEPLLNYSNTVAALKRMMDPIGLDFGARRITVSSIGLVPEIRKLAGEKMQINLAVSLHAPNQELRDQLIPASRNVRIQDLLEACKYFFEQTGRRVTFEYVMIRNMNDSTHLAHELSRILHGLACHVNLIPFNPIAGFDGAEPTHMGVREFGRILLEHGIPVSIRDSQGSEIQAACGQLAGRYKEMIGSEHARSLG